MENCTIRIGLDLTKGSTPTQPKFLDVYLGMEKMQLFTQFLPVAYNEASYMFDYKAGTPTNSRYGKNLFRGPQVKFVMNIPTHQGK